MIIAADPTRIHRPSQQFIHWPSKDFAADIPDGLIDPGYGGTQYGTATVEAANVHQLVQVLHLHRVAPDDEIFQIVDAGNGRSRFAFERCLAPTHNALIGLELHEHIGPVGAGDLLIERDTEDLHAGN